MPPQAIFFDLDDTILDDSGAVARLWQQVTSAAAGQFGDISGETLLAAIDRTREAYWADPERHREGRLDLRVATRRIVATALESLGVSDDVRAASIADDYRAQRDAAICLFPEAIDVLGEVRARAIRTVLVTNGSAAAQRAKIERFGLARYFDRILIEGEFGAGKPDPRVYRAALDAVGVEAAATWMVGDNLEWDVAAPQRFGVTGIWIARDGRDVPAAAGVRPDRVVRDLRDLL